MKSDLRYFVNRKIIRLLCLIVLLWPGYIGLKGQNHVYKEFVQSEWQPYADSLNQNFGAHKKFIKEYELVALIALSYYPELKNVPITFQYRDIKTTCEVRPEFLSALKSSNRKYIIFIDNDTHNQGVLLHDVSFNAQIGVLGHELAHIVDYEHRSIKSLFLLGLNYIFMKNHAKYERSIDRMAIQRGLGWQELEFADFMQNRSKASPSYKRFKQINYLSDTEIAEEIAKMTLYSSFRSQRNMMDPAPKKQ